MAAVGASSVPLGTIAMKTIATILFATCALTGAAFAAGDIKA